MRRMALCFVPGDARARIGFWLTLRCKAIRARFLGVGAGSFARAHVLRQNKGTYDAWLVFGWVGCGLVGCEILALPNNHTPPKPDQQAPTPKARPRIALQRKVTF